VNLNALANANVLETLKTLTVQRIRHSLALRVKQVSLRHDLNNDF
jgi:hypothetical protein